MTDRLVRTGPGLLPLEIGGLPWQEYRCKVTTRACRIVGPFVVETPQGTLACEDGWLALDVNSEPYPIPADVFERTYEAVREEPGPPEAWSATE